VFASRDAALRPPNLGRLYEQKSLPAPDLVLLSAPLCSPNIRKSEKWGLLGHTSCKTAHAPRGAYSGDVSFNTFEHALVGQSLLTS
jgi:hypothetical protein